ncbi:hypothetical protein B0H14DRAFT_3861560 [Mycena olivaceomarginata]|nr:hypothetical protein B0H14DRAFT_3861560 [Mycena olivaceomarginata]
MSDERRHRNRISAQASRDRRKAQLLHLERQVTELEETNGRLRAGLAEATLQLDCLTKSSAAEGRSTGLTQLAPQPNIFILQTSEAPGSGQKIIHEEPNSSHRSGDASVYYSERSTLPACPDIMSTVKKPASFAKAPKKSAKSKATSSHPPWVDMITVLVFFLAVAPPSASLRAGSSLLGWCLDARSPMRKLAGQDRWSPHECITAHPEDTRQGVSRPQIKKFVEMKYKLSIGAAQNTQLSKALTAGSEKNIFVFPKGPSGRVKLAPKTKSADASAKGIKPTKAKPKALH